MLSATEEAQTRALIAQNAALLSLASNEAAIISELGAGDVTLADLPVASSVSDTDLLLIRQGTVEKSATKLLFNTAAADASTTVKGIVELATVAESQAGTDTVRAVTPEGLQASKKIVQVVEATPYTTYTSTAVVLPWDDTIPQITEGVEIQTVTITPRSATNRLRIDFLGSFAVSNSAIALSVALFQDATANALRSVGGYYSDSGDVKEWPLTYEMAAGTTSAITFRIRFGPSANTGYVNGNNAGRKYGGSAATHLRVTEIAP